MQGGAPSHVEEPSLQHTSASHVVLSTQQSRSLLNIIIIRRSSVDRLTQADVGSSGDLEDSPCPSPRRRRSPSPRRPRAAALSRSAAREAVAAVLAGRAPPQALPRPSCQDTLFFEVRLRPAPPATLARTP